MSKSDSTTTKADTKAAALLIAHLSRGGRFGYWWVKRGESKESIWWPVGAPAPIPQAERADVYFGVHPCSEKRGANQRSTIATIAAVNCLFAEFDAKDFDDDKAAALAHVEALRPPASWINDSGGGYHAYWLLAETFALDSDEARRRAREIQAAWVKYTKGDDAAKDLARVLRVPGTRNYKPERAPAFPIVSVVRAELDRLYTLDALASIAEPPASPVAARANGQGKPAGLNGASSSAAERKYVERAVSGEVARVTGAANGERNATLNRAAFSLGQLVAGGVLSRGEAEHELGAAARAVGLAEGETLATIKSGLDAGALEPRRPAPLRPVTIGPKTRSLNGKGAAAAGAPSANETALADDEPEHEPYTDLGNGRRLATRHGDKLRFVAEWGWLVWDGRRWEKDTDGAAMRYAKETALAIQDNEVAAALTEVKAALDEYTAADLAGDEDAIERARRRHSAAARELKDAKEWAKASQMIHRLEAMLKMGSSEPELAAKSEWFDANPYLLNCINGALNLKTGALSPHSREDLITKLIPVEYDAKAKAPLWFAFLERVQAGDKDVISFLQRAVGYSLSGLVEEQALLFMYGTGANGKSVFGNALADLLGDYAQKTRAETLLAKRQDASSNEVAALAGARLVVAAELPQERRLNEALVKDLTGGDVMTARFLYKELFEFRPIFKLWMYGNHKPIVRGTDDGIWRRLKVIPFTVTIPPKERDRKLSEKLRAELAGILAWAVRGFGEWEKRGLDEPERVKAASAEYRAEQDTLGQFLAQACETDPKALAWASALYGAYEKFAGKSEAMTPQAFGRQLSERGFTASKGTGGVRVWRGLRLAEDAPGDK